MSKERSVKALASLQSLLHLALFSIFFLSVSCIYSIDSSVELNPSVEQDSEYVDQLEQSSRKAQVINNFETKYKLVVTYLSPQFREALTNRIEKIYNVKEPFLTETDNSTGFFVSIFSSNDDTLQLSDERLWNVTLTTQSGKHKPKVIRRISDKERWKPFFNQINTWTEEYLVLFDVPSTKGESKLVDQGILRLLLSNAEAKVKLEW